MDINKKLYIKKNMKKTICLAGLLSDTNLGDQAIAECTEYLVKSYKSETTEIKHLDLQYPSVALKSKQGYCSKVLKRISRLFQIEEDIDRRINKLKREYISKIQKSSLIILVGGGIIKYKYQDFWLYIAALVGAADELNIPVFVNAAGVEGYDENDPKCQILKKVLKNKNVIGITTRDDIEILRDKFLDGDKERKSDLVADPAVWASEAYEVNRNKDSDIIGIGLIRGNIFRDNEINFTPDELALLYAKLIVELDKREQKYQLFTNGLNIDTELLDKITSFCNKKITKEEVLVPASPRELMVIISNFRAVLAARLHANILSYSLDVPSIGLVWNEKLSMFGKQINHQDRFIIRKNFESDYILQILDKAIQEGIDADRKEQYIKTTKESIKNLISELNL